MASLPDFSGKGCCREGLVFCLGTAGLIDRVTLQRNAGIFAGIFVHD
jgi:hypothetical protein